MLRMTRISSKQQELFAGNYSAYRQAADEVRLHKLRLQEGVDKKKAQLESGLKVPSLMLLHTNWRLSVATKLCRDENWTDEMHTSEKMV